jgi:uncharacterized membrane protein
MKRGMMLANWCVLCKNSEETVDPLLLHCPMAMEIWNFIFLAFGVNLVPGYLIWYIWRERNKRTFEGQEVAIQGVRS